jgi:hypothetical protein
VGTTVSLEGSSVDMTNCRAVKLLQHDTGAAVTYSDIVSRQHDKHFIQGRSPQKERDHNAQSGVQVAGGH